MEGLAAKREGSVEAVVDLFRKQFSATPSVVAVAPGRVNLIGEHVDHQGYPVVPLALDRYICIAASPAQGVTIHFSLTDETLKCPDVASFRVTGKPTSGNYVAAALIGLLEFATKKHESVSEGISAVGQLVNFGQLMPNSLLNTLKELNPQMSEGFKMVITGNVPVAAGVSSSSALVVAAACALAELLNLRPICDFSRFVLAQICARAERHVGTAGGGMDQAAILLCEAGCARHIFFDPLRAVSVHLPKNCVFVVCNSLQESPKALSAGLCYNKRVFELKLACFMLLRNLNPDIQLTGPELVELTLRKVQETYKMETFDEMIQLATNVLPSMPLGKSDVESILGGSLIDFLLEKRCGFSVWEMNVAFEPLRRVLHVYGESRRVERFIEVCLKTDVTDGDKMRELGALMNKSDESLTLLFDCGSSFLSELSATARSLGAFGSRLTGAGWGGCVVSMIRQQEAEQFVAAMKTKYYNRKERLIPLPPLPSSLNDVCFIVTPDSHASVYSVREDGTFAELYFSESC